MWKIWKYLLLYRYVHFSGHYLRLIGNLSLEKLVICKCRYGSSYIPRDTLVFEECPTFSGTMSCILIIQRALKCNCKVGFKNTCFKKKCQLKCLYTISFWFIESELRMIKWNQDWIILQSQRRKNYDVDWTINTIDWTRHTLLLIVLAVAVHWWCLWNYIPNDALMCDVHT